MGSVTGVDGCILDIVFERMMSWIFGGVHAIHLFDAVITIWSFPSYKLASSFSVINLIVICKKRTGY